MGAKDFVVLHTLPNLEQYVERRVAKTMHELREGYLAILMEMPNIVKSEGHIVT